jgi:hypothetical protein
VKIDRALAIAARARIRRRVASDVVSQSDGIGATSSSKQLVLRDVRGRFAKGHAGGPGRPPRDCLRDAFAADLFLIWRRHGKQALRQLCHEEPESYLRLMTSLFGSKTRSSREQYTIEPPRPLSRPQRVSGGLRYAK